MNEEKLAILLEMIKIELKEATLKNGAFNSSHEGYAVILEELDELWDEVKANRGYDLTGAKEAIQVGAMALRYLYDISYPSMESFEYAPK